MKLFCNDMDFTLEHGVLPGGQCPGFLGVFSVPETERDLLTPYVRLFIISSSNMIEGRIAPCLRENLKEIGHPDLPRAGQPRLEICLPGLSDPQRRALLGPFPSVGPDSCILCRIQK